MSVTNKVRIADLPANARLIGGDDVFVRKWHSLTEFEGSRYSELYYG